MNRNRITIGTALVLMLTGTVGAAEAKTRHFHCQASGTFADGVETHIDTNGDGASAGLDQGLKNCSNGNFFFQEEVEWVSRPVTSACPQGTDEELYIDQTHGQHRGVETNEKTTDQIFEKLTSGTLCVNLHSSPFTFTSSSQQEVIGGTGKYSGATGSEESHVAGSYLTFGFKDGVFGGFGQFTATNNGTLTLPKGEDDRSEQP